MHMRITKLTGSTDIASDGLSLHCFCISFLEAREEGCGVWHLEAGIKLQTANIDDR